MADIRLHSRFSLTSTLALAAAAVVTVGISPGAQAAGDKGRLRLQLGTVNQFVYEARLPGDNYSETYPVVYQSFGAAKKGCLLQWLSGSQLAVLTPRGGANALYPGFGPTSIGVYDGPNGTPCTRVSQYAGESLEFSFGPDTTGGSIAANAFDKLELDVEVKGDAVLELETHLGSIVTGRFHLQTGSSITGVAAPPKSDGQPVDSSPTTPVVACSARSDSGPDSGPNDNCRWIIKNIIGQSFTVRPITGEFSLEGGGDWEGTTLYRDKNSFIYLTSVTEGDLICGGSTPAIGDGSSTAKCRVDGAPVGYCPTPSIHYFLRNIGGSYEGCDFMKASSGQLVASIAITFPPEPPDLNSTKVFFPRPSGGYAEYDPGLCTGTVVGLDDHPTITEVLGATKPAGYVDVVPETAAADWACILDQKVVDKSSAGVGYIQVEQRILFWGDPLIVRQ